MKKIPWIHFLLFALVLSSCQLLSSGSKDLGCGPSTLKIGDHSYQIDRIRLKQDGSMNIPPKKADTAFWVVGTTTNQVFALSPTETNLALSSTIKQGDTISVAWATCNVTTYTVSSVGESVPANTALVDQSTSQVTIFVRGTASGFVVKGDLAEETITTFNTPNASEKQAEISLLGTSPSRDGKSINIAVSVNNYGTSAFTLSPSDIALTTADGTQLALSSSEPALPKEIAAGKTESFTLTFPRPSTATATLKILTVEYDVEGY
jgi:hypothetical protein